MAHLKQLKLNQDKYKKIKSLHGSKELNQNKIKTKEIELKQNLLKIMEIQDGDISSHTEF